MDNNKKFWQRFAKLYQPLAGKSYEKIYQQISVRVRKYLNKDMNVLELACGSGQLSCRLAQQAKSWKATDFSENMIAQAEKLHSINGLTFSVKDATNLPYENGSFDAVMISNALHIMPNPQKALKEIYRVLKPNGVLFAPTFIVGKSIKYKVRMVVMSAFGFKCFSKWTADEFEKYVSIFGFKKQEADVLGGTSSPLCCLIARK